MGGGVSWGLGKESGERLEELLLAEAQLTLVPRLDRPTRIRFSDSAGSVLFEHPAAPPRDGLVR